MYRMLAARCDRTIRYDGMTSRTLNRILTFNEDNQLEVEDQLRNLNLAFESYAKARRARDEYKRIDDLRYAMDDRFVNARKKAMLAQKMAELRREGLWSPDNPENLRWFDWNTTLARKNQVEQEGIIVRCAVEWSTGSIWDPLLMITVALERDYPSYFPSHVPQNPDVERHYSVVHMGECERSVPNWGYHTSEIFKHIHGRS